MEGGGGGRGGGESGGVVEGWRGVAVVEEDISTHLARVSALMSSERV